MTMYPSVCIDLHLFSLGFIDAYWFSLTLNGSNLYSLISIRSHCAGYHQHTARRSNGTLRVVRGEAAMRSYTIKKYFIILYIGRLALDVQPSVPNIRQWASKSHASLTCTH